MRVVMNVSAAAGDKTGIGHYTAELLKALRSAGEVEMSAYPPPLLLKIRSIMGGGPKQTPAAKLAGKLIASSSPIGPVSTGRASWRQKVKPVLRDAFRVVNNACSRGALDPELHDLYHEPNFFVLPGRLPVVATVHDLSPLFFPEWHPADRVELFERHFTRNIRRIAHVLAVSEFAREEIIRTFGFSPDRVTRTYNGVREHFRPLPSDETANTLRSLGLPPTYLLHVGTIEPRKNLDMLLRAYCSLPDDLRQRCPLVLVGSWGWRMEDTARYFDEVARHKNVIRPGYLPDDALPAVFNGARALVFPTLYEGFGMPAAEMLACGGAVVSSTAGAVAEVLGICGHLIDPHDVDGWRNAMAKVITDDDWRNELRRGGLERAAEFTWQACARDTLKAYRKTLEQVEAG